MIKVKAIWTAQPFPHNWEFNAQCEEGQSIPIVVKHDDKSTKMAPNPKEVILQGMATCTGIDVVSILQKMRQPLESLSVECNGKLTEQHPIIFSECNLIYHIKGNDLAPDRVALAVKLSFMDYCGVTAMIKKSGCHITPKLFINEKEVNIWDPKEQLCEKLKKWLKEIALESPKGIALITGSSRGIGYTLAKYLVKEGYAVIPTSRSPVTFEEKEIFESLYLDVTKKNSILALTDLLEKSDIKLSLLIHNAGTLTTVNEISKSNALNLSSREFDEVFQTNFVGIFESNNALIPFMSPHSKILMTSSIMGHSSYEDYSFMAYRISKRAVAHYAKLVALQCDAENKKITILSFHPGSVKTDMNLEGAISLDHCAKNIMKLISEPMTKQLQDNNGEFWSYNEKKSEWQCLK
ncbi:SDR family NAD(P)-dependent oxidoreductase [Silvanigrella aquatica]|uniref:Uncharacterized protein n=1 Tax=Silvanigrella aquatica TaxID=1915309 RepID=A0A1L4D238_9BACT|nr:SDR family NAD(P)-dependent oxidoreductase [Silvanigrella aquatica]APJ04269.1 hypothetical protein AXG55_10265 [Silvanigrella aquatica]